MGEGQRANSAPLAAALLQYENSPERRRNTAPLAGMFNQSTTTSERSDRASAMWPSSHSFLFENPPPATGDPEKGYEAHEGIHTPHVIINLVKCAVGAGSFSLPDAFVKTGLLAGIVGLILFGTVGGYTMTLLADAEKAAIELLQCRRREAAEKGDSNDNEGDEAVPIASSALEVLEGEAPVTRLTYPELVEVLFPTMRLCGRHILADIVYMAIILTSIGVCVAYVLFILSTLKDAFGVDVDLTLLVLFIPILGLALLRSFYYLAYTSVLGDVAVVAGIVGTIWAGLSEGRELQWPTDAPAVNTNWESGDLLRGLATISFLFLVHILTLPMAQSLHRDLEEPAGFRKVVAVSYNFITVLNLGFAMLCVCIFEWKDIQNPVTGNLKNGIPVQIVKVLLCLDLLFTVPMVLSVGREIIENSVLNCLPQSAPSDRPQSSGSTARPYEEAARNGVRLLLVLVVCGVAWLAASQSGVNKAFGNVLDLLGGFTNCLVGLVIPPIVYWKASRGVGGNNIIFDVLLAVIAVVGLGLMFSSTFYTIREIVDPTADPGGSGGGSGGNTTNTTMWQ